MSLPDSDMIECRCGFVGHYYMDQGHWRQEPQSCIRYLAATIEELKQQIAEMKKKQA